MTAESKTPLFIVTNLDNGGIENYLLRYLKLERHRFRKIYVICKSGRFGQLEGDYRNLPNVHLIKHKIGYINPFDLIRFYKKVKLIKPDAICDFTGNFAGLTLFCSRLLNVPVRLSFYRNSSTRFKTNPFKEIYNSFVQFLTVKCSTQLLSNSYAAINYFFPNNTIARQKFTVIYNGIDAKSFYSNKNQIRTSLNIPKTGFVVGHVGRFNEAKNHATIIKVAIELCENDSNIFFILCGNEVRDTFEKLILQKGMSAQIKLFNNHNKIIEVYNSLDCFYFPSITEGQPNALIEAMICGIPFVASNIEPIKETVPMEYHDWLVDPKDCESAKNKIYQIKAEGGFTINSRQIAEQFDAKIQFGKFTQKIIQCQNF